MTSKKANKTKFLSEELHDLINESQFLKDSSPVKKTTQKRQRNDASEEDGRICELLGQFKTNSKKKKFNANIEEACKESRLKIIDVMDHQIGARKEKSNGLLNFLSEFTAELEADYNTMKDNEKKLEHLTGAVLKCMQQSTASYKKKLNVLNEFNTTFKKRCEEMESDHKADIDKLAQELEDDIKNLQQKLISETKRNGWETLRKTIFQAMQNDF